MIPVVVGSSPIGHPRILRAILLAIALTPALAQAEPPHFSAFFVCLHHGCSSIVPVALTPHEWDSVRQLFRDTGDAQTERQRIAQAIALLERIATQKLGTTPDAGGTSLPRPGQMDCIDESANSTTYLTMLARDRLLAWHTVEDRATRGWLLFGWPHTTAVIRDSASGERYAVDSWFFDNGIEPVIIPLKIWKKGWRP